MGMHEQYQRGDKLFHLKRPEWGQGVVAQATTITHEGNLAQRLSIDFPNKGRVVINTAVAPLATQGNFTDMNTTGLQEKKSGGWLGALEKAAGVSTAKELWDLPEKLSDPFLSNMERLVATLETFRFSTEPRSLIDWAIVQTSLNDPLSKYTRHELEQAFPRFERDRNLHLKTIVIQLKREGQLPAVKSLAAKIKHPAAKEAMEKVFRAL
ncbi:DUF3553 domain-containing protein [Poriferisphaera sp. WC338]|uniref:DUF3553 domain-containing protein n=1 Tax=Poriferisphaera sp. WC338 TaxID=3425129 RepID=UPI003D81B501